MTQTFVVVGANLAGGNAAQALRAEGFTGRLVLVGAEDQLPYERPPLSKELLLGTKTFADTLLQPESFYDEHDIDLRLGRRVVRIGATGGEVELDDGSAIRADKVLLCTGSRPRLLEVEGAHLPGVTYLRTLEDAERIRNALTQGASLVVVGCGFVGTELAASACSLGNDVTMLELDDVPLHRILGRDIGDRIARLHLSQGVRLLTGVGVARFEGDTRVRRVVTTDGRVVDADLVVIGVGVEPETELAVSAGLDVDNGIVVDGRCQTSNPAVFAAGDVANHFNPVLGRRIRLEHWQNAQNQGIAAARSMLGSADTYGEVPWFWSHQYDVNLQVAGHPHADDDVVWRGTLESLDFAAFYLRAGVLVGAIGANRPRDVRSATRLIAARGRPDPALLTDPTVDLRKVDLATPDGAFVPTSA
jgi:3-phenylpropionate/trans-cinnamate dioxygenase ferredoxin reductase subunit